ncbi:MAG: succinyl-diaminopimelate desuccinylase [Gammaproteobacteria bacterium]|nr:succinyl-diaminopimelate desuccinylase [Gammaproteobacteria bacterium]MDH3405625.1 succinyl-diaminopimelate desuccinylase [Gammaproteobacteria bacterium]
MPDKTLELAKELIARPSQTPRDEGCQEILIKRLEPLGFKSERLPYGDVENLWAVRGNAKPLLVFAGHTDVVPSGPREAWKSDPYQPEIRDGHLYGRGASDMKSSLAAFITGIEDFLAKHPKHKGSIGLLITSDEEGPAVNGTVKVMEWLGKHGIKIDYCVVGEPSCTNKLGDTIKIGRRGSLTGRLTVRGKQGHVAYPHLAKNPIHMLAPALAELATIEWDRGNADFPPTSFQISNIHGGTGAENVIPGRLEVVFNFRFSTAVTEADLRRRVEEILQRHGVEHQLQWVLSGHPFLTRGTALIEAVRAAVKQELDMIAETSTSGGTSDGRFIAPAGTEVVEIGPLNRTIHQIDECIAVDDISRLARVYRRILENVLL